jgi:hypothetical protein
VTDARDPSAGIPMRQPSDGVPSRQPGGPTSARQFNEGLPERHPSEAAPGGFSDRDRGGFSDRDRGSVGGDRGDRGGYGDDPPPRGQEAFPVRRPSVRLPRASGGRHRRAVPASLPQSAPALVLAVPGKDTDLTSGAAGELTAVLRVDNPAVEVRAGRIDGGGPGDPSDLQAVLVDVASRRPDGPPCAVVIPLIATVNPPVIHRLRESVAASGVNAIVSGFINSNAMVAEALHIRLAEAGLARADRVRLFSIVTAADGVLIATVGGPHAAASANVTSVLLAARLALPVITASMDSAPSVQEGAMRLKEMGVNRLAIAPCFIGPEANRGDLESLIAVGADCAAPIGAHSNIAKLAALTYGQAISSLDLPSPGDQDKHGQHE